MHILDVLDLIQQQPATGLVNANRIGVECVNCIQDTFIDWVFFLHVCNSLYGHVGRQGAVEACDRLTALGEFESSQTVKVNPDRPQQQARFVTLDVSSCHIPSAPSCPHPPPCRGPSAPVPGSLGSRPSPRQLR